MTRVAILGCGPAGLLAAHAARTSGIQEEDITILSKMVKSELHGAQYMGAPIPFLDMGEPRNITYRLIGTREEYSAKVYGEDWTGQVSPDDFEGDHRAWDIRAMYDQLWAMYSHLIEETLVGPTLLATEMSKYDKVFSSIPKPGLCIRKDEHWFSRQKIWAIGDHVDNPREMYFQCPNDTIICYGTSIMRFYRVSNVFGYRTVEWPYNARPYYEGAALVNKPIANNCDCWEMYGLINIGRFGRWEKGILVHDAYQQARRAFR